MSAEEEKPGASAEAGCPCKGALTPKLYSRRKFFTALSVVTGAAAAVGVAVPIGGFVVSPLFESTPEVWRKVGKVEEFQIGNIVEVSYKDASPLAWSGITANTAAWLHRKSDTEFQAFSVNCTHLGCPVRYLESAELFMCPCHGGVYYKNGDVAAGPPPKPLQQYNVRVYEGDVEIQTGPIPITTA